MSRPPRIVHVYKDVYPPVEGGIERIIHHLARLTAGEFDPRVLVASRSLDGVTRTIAGGVPVTEVPCWGRWLSTPLAPGFIRALRASGADLLHFHVPHPTGEVAWLLSGLTVPAVATYHSDVVRQRWAMRVYHPVFQRFLSRLRVIMPTSQRYLDSSEPLRPHRDRCRVVPLGYPLEEYAVTPGIRKRMKRLKKEFGPFVLFLGCLRAYKGLPNLLMAMKMLGGAVPLLIAGEGPMRATLEETARQLGIAPRVHFLGRVAHEDAVALLRSAAVLVLPSHLRSEAFGLCQIEAMACATPVISTDLPTGVPEVNAHGVSGLVVPPQEPQALADALRRLLEDAAYAQALGRSGLCRAQTLYRAEQMAGQVAQVYRDVLGR